MEQHAGLAYACYFLLGSGILAPWNAFITAADYFEAVFPGRHMDRLFTVAYLPVCLLMLGLLIKFNSLPGRPRILFSFAGFVLIMLAVPLIDLSFVGQEGSGPDSALTVVLLAVVLVGVLDGLSQGAIFADAAALPPQYTHAVVGGTASSGVIICLLRIATKAALPPTRAGLRKSTAIYFSISGGITLCCFAVYYAVLPRLGVVRYHKRALQLGVLSEDIQSADLGSWYPILLITAFNISDLVGKNIPFCGLTPSPRTLLACSLLRVVFVPAFLLAGRHAGGVASLMALLTVSLGFSNGLLTALLMTLAPASVECGEEGLVESIMVFSLVLGLTLGALAGWLWLL
ncbi:nucleoside transporter-domain-containing protein [Scenedesmus sp. NREL 46B-D3]|nr:nucleoside transporter-domain-containing protein [Scenedesmus sp. NREL 46B-D3]